MVLDAMCMDALPKSAPAGAPFYGPESVESIATASADADAPLEALLVLFGRRQDGRSVCAVVKGYKPWARIVYNKPTSSLKAGPIKTAVVARLEPWFKRNKITDHAERESRVTVEAQKLPLFYGFEPASGGAAGAGGAAPAAPSAERFAAFKVRFATFEECNAFERGFQYCRLKDGGWQLTDNSTPSAIRALNDLKLAPSGWVGFSDATACGARATRISTCDIEFDTWAEYLQPLPDMTAVAPLKVLSFDAEMYSHDNGFPEVIHGDPPIAVCASLLIYGQSDIQRTAFVVWDHEANGPLPVTTEGLAVVYVDSPEALFEAFRDYIAATDPDVLTGWNIYGFDMPYMWDHYKAMSQKLSLRGSEALHASLMDTLLKHREAHGRPQLPFKTLGALIQGPLESEKRKALKSAIDKLPMRHKLVLRSPEKLPEAVAAPLRALVTVADPKLEKGELEVLRAVYGPGGTRADGREAHLFQTLMSSPATTGIQRASYLGRWAYEPSELLEKRMASAAKGDNTYYFWSGRVCVDMMQIIKDDKKLEDNSLKFAAQQFLDPEFGKIDLTPAEIFQAYRSNDAGKMAAMLDYCARDADIPVLLIKKLSYVPIWVEMSRVTFTPLGAVLNGGQQRKVYNLIAHFVHDEYALNKGESGWPVSTVEDAEGPDSEAPVDAMEDALQKRRPDYQGATVIEPAKGYYRESVSTLDFESLYPSIIIHFNLCPSVYVGSVRPPGPDGRYTSPKASAAAATAAARHAAIAAAGFALETHTIDHAILVDAKTDAYEEFSQEYTFVKNVQGLVPRLLQHLLRARKAAKKAMAAAPDEFERAVQNGRQLALKVSCNSVYGFFGVAPKRGLLSCKPIAAVTTLRGRAFIEASKTYVEANYAGSKVLYGDTGE